MSGPKKDMMKLSEQGIVTEEALIAYLQNKLSPEEQQQMEKLLQEDPFAQDALEGLKSSLNQAAIATSISSLNKKVRERTGLKERKGLQLHWVTYAWGVVIFGLIIGICFILINFFNKKSSTPDVPGSKENITTPVLQPKDTAALSEKPQITIADSLTGKIPVTDTSASVAKSKPAATVPNANGTYAATGTPGQKPASTPPPKDVKAPAPQKPKADSAKPVSSNTSKNTQPAKAETKDLATLQNDAMKSFNSGDYAAAGDAFEQILKREPDNADALYFGGISDYINNKTAKSESSFDKLLKKGNKYVDGSKWYKANILIKKGHSESAKPLLQEISSSNSPYKERAIKKLAELGF